MRIVSGTHAEKERPAEAGLVICKKPEPSVVFDAPASEASRKQARAEQQ
jgi:hypothetical protein